MADKERQELEAWLAAFRQLRKHPSTGQRTENIKEDVDKKPKST